MRHALLARLAIVVGAVQLLGMSPSNCIASNGGNRATAIGGVHDFIKGPRGQIVGATLDDGTIVRWPSSAGPPIARIVRIGDWIEAMGRRIVDPAGGVTIDARMVLNLATDVSFDIDQPPGSDAETRAPTAPPSRTPAIRSVQGTVDRFTASSRGVVDGAQLSNGRRIHWSPNVTPKILSICVEGDQIEANGRPETISGIPVLKALKITNVRTGASAVDDEGASPRSTNQSDGAKVDVQQRLNALQAQLENIQVEIDRLRELATAPSEMTRGSSGQTKRADNDER